MSNTSDRRARGASARGPVKPFVVLAVVAALAATLFAATRGGAGGGNTAAPIRDADLVIPVAEVTEAARFYPVEIEGTTLEVIAVEAADGTIRTAFNTCQVCYDSGRGYYKQDGGALVCQNCGNRFLPDQVELQSGGCNPVPIFPENKTVSDESITISEEFLGEARVIFSNWKTAY